MGCNRLTIEQLLRFLFDIGEVVTRCKTVPCQCILLIFINFCYILLAKQHAASLFVFRGFLWERFLFNSIKPFKKSVLRFPDFSSFVSYFVLLVGIVQR